MTDNLLPPIPHIRHVALNKDSASEQLQRAHVAVVVIDIVESVALMQTDFEDVVARWQRMVRAIRAQVLTAHTGTLVKSLGDGLLMTFPHTDAALAATFEVMALVPEINSGSLPERALVLRASVHETDVLFDDLDIYGPGVNLAARLLTLAHPGEVVVSDKVRDAIHNPYLASFSDLGPCFLKHIEHPVRAFTARPAKERVLAVHAPVRAAQALRPTIAVLNFEVTGTDATQRAWGEVLSHELTRMLSQQSICGVVSRLSVQGLRNDESTIEAHFRRLGVTYLVTGECSPTAGGAQACYALWLRGSGKVLTGKLQLRFDELHDPDSEQLNRWIGTISAAVMGLELRRAGGLNLPALEDFTLLFAGVSMMHKTSASQIQRAGDTLELLVDRHPRLAEPRVWLAKLHVLRMANGVTTDAVTEAQRARQHIRRALGDEPAHALALTVEGLVCLFLERDLLAARACYEQALLTNRNEALAWLFLSSVHAHAGEGTQAMGCVDQARSLSPADPLTHYFDGFTAWALLSAGRYPEAAAFASSAMAANGSHRPSYITLTMAQQLAGEHHAARQTAAAALALLPNFTVAAYLKGYPGGTNLHAERLAQALRQAGLPH